MNNFGLDIEEYGKMTLTQKKMDELSNYYKQTKRKLSRELINEINNNLNIFYINQEFTKIQTLYDNIKTIVVEYIKIASIEKVTLLLENMSTENFKKTIKYLYINKNKNFILLKNKNEQEIRDSFKKYDTYYKLNNMNQIDALFLYTILRDRQDTNDISLLKIVHVDYSTEEFDKLKETNIFNMQYIAPALINENYAKAYEEILNIALHKINTYS